MSSPDVSGSIPGLFVQCISLYQNDEEKQLFFLRLLTVVLCFQVFSFISVAQSCPTLCDPMDCSMQYFTISWTLLKLKSIRSVLPSYHLILYCPLLLPSIFPASGSFPMSLLFTSGGHSVGASALASVLPMNILFLYLLKSYSRGQIWRWFVMLCLLEIFGCI